nr:hypothetical protein [Nelson Astrovirus-like 1]
MCCPCGFLNFRLGVIFSFIKITMAPSKIPILVARVQRQPAKPRSQKRRRQNPQPRQNNNKMSPRRNTAGRRNPRGRMNINAVSVLNGTERITTVTIPTSTVAGTLLYMLENNPTSAPRASAVSSQFDSWSSTTEIEVETTGNAFAKNFIVIRHVPNGDPSRLPADPESLLNFAEAYSRPGESYKLQLDSNAKGIVRAPYRATTYNPHKPIRDQDPSERNNGLFIIVANGSPGTDPVDITIRYRYSFRFFGPIFRSILPNLSSRFASAAGSTPALPFGTAPTRQGPAASANTNNSVTFVPGTYISILRITGTGITVNSVPSSPGITFTTVGAALSATQAVATYTFTLLVDSVVTFSAATATTIDGAQFTTAPYDLTV